MGTSAASAASASAIQPANARSVASATTAGAANSQTAASASTGQATISQNAASVPTTVVTPAGAVAITLTPPVPAPVPLHGNVVFWVSIISFIGVALSLWQAHQRMTRELTASEERLKTELKASAEEATIERNQAREQASLDRQHHTDQAHQERITKARREVYLELISEMTKAQFAISQFPTQPIDRLEIQSGFGGLITATSKISILGEMPTVTMSRELLSAINGSMMKMLTLLIPISEQKEEATRLQAEADEHRLEIKNGEAALKNRVFQYSADGHNLAQELTARTARIGKLQQAILTAKLAFNDHHRIYYEAHLSETKAIGVKVDELICAIRQELGLLTSMDELKASSAAMHEAAQAATQRLSAGLQENAKAS